MKIRTIEQLYDKIQEDYAWRLKELNYTKNLVKNSPIHLRNSTIRLAIPNLYAHWAMGLLGKEYSIDLFIEEGKQLGFIERTRLEKVRKSVEFYNNNNPYIIKGTIANDKFNFNDPKIILIQDLNRIVHDYELVIRELEDKE